MENINKQKYPVTIRIEDDDHWLEMFRHRGGYSFTLVAKTPFFSYREKVMLRNDKEHKFKCDNLRIIITDYAKKHGKAKDECSGSISVSIPEESGSGFKEYTTDFSSFEHEYGPLMVSERMICDIDPEKERCDQTQRDKIRKFKAIFKLIEVCKGIPKEDLGSEELQGRIFKQFFEQLLLINYPDFFDGDGQLTKDGKYYLSSAEEEMQRRIDKYPIKVLSSNNK